MRGRKSPAAARWTGDAVLPLTLFTNECFQIDSTVQTRRFHYRQASYLRYHGHHSWCLSCCHRGPGIPGLCQDFGVRCRGERSPDTRIIYLSQTRHDRHKQKLSCQFSLTRERMNFWLKRESAMSGMELGRNRYKLYRQVAQRHVIHSRSRSSPMSSKTDSRPFGTAVCFWCARRDLNPHVRSGH